MIILGKLMIIYCSVYSLRGRRVLHSRSLELPHEDPADRFLAATAFVYDLTLVTADKRLHSLKKIKILKGAEALPPHQCIATT